MSQPAPVFQLTADCQSYDWGKIGSNSKAAQYAAAAPGFKLDESKPYAELWMGTHPNVPSKLLSTSETLAHHLASHPELLGDKIVKHFGADLPFLFKVLAIHKALSIQAHPDKKLAEKLHKERPDLYKDANHKPEMAIAITAFSGFCGFLPLSQIATYLKTVPEYAALIDPTATASLISAASSNSGSQKEALKAVFASLMEAPVEKVKEQVKALVERYSEADSVKPQEAGVADLAMELEGQFPGDVGVMCVFMLNVVHLQPGEAVFLKANDPHAYISGDIIECMATSDNVVRAGLTPKVRDVPTLVNMLTYATAPASEQLLPPQAFRGSKHTALYDPPIEEFAVLLTRLAAGEEESYGSVEGPSVFIVTEGDGQVGWEAQTGWEELKEGHVWFIGAGTDAKFKAGSKGLVVYRAFAEAP